MRGWASRAASPHCNRRDGCDGRPRRTARRMRATGTAVSASACERSDHAPCGRRFVIHDSHKPRCNARRDPHALTLLWCVSVFPSIAERRSHLVCAGGDLCPDKSDAYTGRRVLLAGAGALAATAGYARADAGSNPTGVDRLSRGAAHWHGCTHRLEPVHHGSGPRRSGQPRAGRTTAVPALHYGLQRRPLHPAGCSRHCKTIPLGSASDFCTGFLVRRKCDLRRHAVRLRRHSRDIMLTSGDPPITQQPITNRK